MTFSGLLMERVIRIFRQGVKSLVVGILLVGALWLDAIADDPWFGYGNPDPAALTYGLYFASEIPMEMRKAIVDDLTWLYSVGVLKSSSRLNRFRKISSTDSVTGAELVSWLLARLKIIVPLESICHRERALIVNGSRPNRPPIVFHEETGFECTEERRTYAIASGATAFETAGARDVLAKEVYGYRLDGNIAMFPGSMMSVIGLSLDKVHTSSDFYWRTMRLEVLFHEALHVETRVGHTDCTGWGAAPPMKLIVGYAITEPTNGCDKRASSASSYVLSALIVNILAENCSLCTGEQLARLRLLEADRWARVEVPLRAPVVILALDSSKQRENTRRLDAAPPLMMFEALQAYIDDGCLNDQTSCSSQARSELRSLSDFFQQVQADKQFDGVWDGSAPDDVLLDYFGEQLVTTGREADDWVMQIPLAAGRGYNLPMKWIRPCTDFQRGCT